MKRGLSLLLAVVLMCAFSTSALGFSSNSSDTDQAFVVEVGKNLQMPTEEWERVWGAPTFTSMDTKIAKVSKNGTVTGVSVGTTQVVYQFKNNPQLYYSNIQVTPKSTMTLNKSSVTLYFGSGDQFMYELKATVTPAEKQQNLIWTSSNTNAVVVMDGVIIANAKGSAIVTAQTADGNLSASCKVKVDTAKIKKQSGSASLWGLTFGEEIPPSFFEQDSLDIVKNDNSGITYRAVDADNCFTYAYYTTANQKGQVKNYNMWAFTKSYGDAIGFYNQIHEELTGQHGRAQGQYVSFPGWKNEMQNLVGAPKNDEKTFREYYEKANMITSALWQFKKGSVLLSVYHNGNKYCVTVTIEK